MLALVLACGDPSAPVDPALRTDPTAPPPADVLDVPRVDEVAARTWTVDGAGVGLLASLDPGTLAVFAESEDETQGFAFSPSTPSGSLSSAAPGVPLDLGPFLTSAPSDDDGDGNPEIWLAGFSETVRVEWDGAAWSVQSTRAGQVFWPFLTGGVDVTGDGLSDVALGAELVFGPFPAEIQEADLVELRGQARIGGDFDGDGVGDALVVDRGLGIADLYGAPTAPPAPATWVSDALAARDAGDVNGDGWRDALVTANAGWDATESWSLVLGPVGAAGTGSALAAATLITTTEAPVSLGDVDGDGRDDLAIVEPDPWFGVVGLVRGPIEGIVDEDALERWRGPTPYDGFGAVILTSTLDGAPALAISAPNWGHGGDAEQGGAFLVAVPPL